MGDNISEILAFWNSLERPLVQLGPGENCEDLQKLLSKRNILPRHLEAVHSWVKEKGWQGSNKEGCNFNSEDDFDSDISFLENGK